MFPMFRVVAVAMVLFAFTASMTPAYAAPRDGGRAGVEADSGWFQAAFAWLSEVVYGETPVPRSPKTKAPKTTKLNGPCVDPFGRCT
jgi:hypothetical protein